MPVFGFVLTLAPAREAQDALTTLAREPDVTLGALEGARLPVVLDLEPAADAEARVERWRALPGVLHVDYAFADFDDLVSDARDEEGPTP
jgi:hypothetical protein